MPFSVRFKLVERPETVSAMLTIELGLLSFRLAVKVFDGCPETISQRIGNCQR